MNSEAVGQLANNISGFLEKYQTQLANIASHSTNVFEAMCFVLFARYYEEEGYQLKPENLADGKFHFRYSTNGNPWNFSYFAVLDSESADTDARLFEIRHNQKVAGAWITSNKDVEDGEKDPPLFAVDVAVVETGSLPSLPRGHARGKERIWVENCSVITFAEAKKLKAYPMLLAQFLGIVHEIKPEFLNIEGHKIHGAFDEQRHPPPTLLTSDYLTWGAEKVLQSFEERNIRVRVLKGVSVLSEETLLDLLRGN